MIKTSENLFELHTKHTSYVMGRDESGNLLGLYYGKRIEPGDGAALFPKITNQNGCCIIGDEARPMLSLDDVRLECGTVGKGDMRDPMIEAVFPDGSNTLDLRFEKAEVSRGKVNPDGLPGAYFEEEEDVSLDSSLVITLKDKDSALRVLLIYTAFEEADCITRMARIVNDTDGRIILIRALSACLDINTDHLRISSFHGDWTREMNKTDTTIRAGRFISDSATGFSSNHSNPFVMYGFEDTSEYAGECFATNLIYSGSHRESGEISAYGKARIMTGINPDKFRWILDAGETFDTPEAVFTFSDTGYEGISRNMHRFVREHIVRGYWKHRERPILLNSWEACYFDVKERRILSLAKAARDVGVELFVLDDGWFAARDNDKTSLGDWYENYKKIPGGLPGISSKIRAQGLKFGIWVEPEMVNEDSMLYRKHPEWAVKVPGRDHALGRNQMILDLTREDVQDYITDAMTDVFDGCKADYVKWDMNRHMSDMYSNALEPGRQGEFNHRYIKGLYSILGRLTERFPTTLFEACASGGNRFDLGMLCFMPQVWASDCTDALQRTVIQNGYSYGYPQSVMGAHVSSVPNHQTLRVTPLESRFAVAMAGILGYECNLSDLGDTDLEEIKEQIALYKEWRELLQFGDFYRVKAFDGTFAKETVEWMIVSPDKSKAVGIVMQGIAQPNREGRIFRARGLEDSATYRFTNRTGKYNVKRMGDLINTAAPIHIKQNSLVHNVVSRFYKLESEKEEVTVSGSLLNNAGVCLAQSFTGTGMGDNTGIFADFDARVYYMVKEKE